MFEVSKARKKILKKLTEKDWTPTDLAKELDKSPETIYNHLNNLANKGILTKKQIPAKTRPKTLYSIQEGYIEYISVLPGDFSHKTLKIDTNKKVLFRIWNIPQQQFHRYIETYWYSLKTSADIDLHESIKGIAVYGSVARGQANEESDIDILIITKNQKSKETIENTDTPSLIDTKKGRKLFMPEIYTTKEYKNSLSNRSNFLENILNELHILYDPKNILRDSKENLNKIDKAIEKIENE